MRENAHQRIAVSGGAGFIGSHTVECLARAGHQVLVLDDLSQGNVENLTGIRPTIEFRLLDVRDRDGCARALCAWRPDVVVHLAAVASVPRSIAEPGYVHDVNLNGTFNVLEAARLSGACRFVLASSAAVYGLRPALPCTEGDAVEPASPYAAQKAAGELLCGVYRRIWGLEAVTLRFFNVYGPRQLPSSEYSGVISAFLASLLSTGCATIHGDGEQSRDFVYVSDVVRAIEAAAAGGDPGQGPINVASGDAISIRTLYRLLAARLHVADEPVYAAARSGDVQHSHASVARMRERLGVAPEVALGTGLDRLIMWFAEHPQRAASVSAGADHRP
jgi:nucleoside-diphosphate-sugar epimerase